MPVHRLPGAKGRVFAYVEELEAWRTCPDAVAEPGPTLEPGPAAPVPPARRSRAPWLVPAVVAIALCVGAAWALRPRAMPVKCRTEGRAVIVYDATGREIWRKVLPVTPVELEPLAARLADPPRFLDLDGDGRPELFYPVHRSLDDLRDDELYVFSPDGAVLWHRTYGELVRTAKGPVDGPYIVRRVALVPGTGHRETRIVLAVVSRLHSATRLMVLDQQGQVLRTYWHAGHTMSLLVTDHDGDGKPEIYAGSVANGYDCADVTVLDPDTLGGASGETNPEEQIVDVGPPVEKARILLPVSSMSRAVQKYNGISIMVLVGKELMVSTIEDMMERYKGSIAFYFGPKLTLSRALAADMNYVSHHQLHVLKLLPDELTRKEVDSYRNIRVLTPWH